MRYWWSGPSGGLGNRLIALAAVKACIEEHAVHFSWSVDPSCPGAYEDILKPISNLVTQPSPPTDASRLDTHGWEPLSIYKKLNERLKLELPVQQFCEKFIFELRHIPFHDELTLSAKKWRQSHGAAALLGVHIRRTDRAAQHRDQFRAFVMRKQGLNRELPLYLSALYGLCPASFMRAYENIALSYALRLFKSSNRSFRYAIFSDDEQESLIFEKTATFFGIENERSLKEVSQKGYSLGTKSNDIRKTDIKNAVIDMLCLSECDAIAQSNRASTFSLVASIIGAKPIITARSRYPFWHIIEKTNSMSPNDPRMISHGLV